MLTEVATAFVDASAAHLRLTLDLPRQPALESTVVHVAPFAVELRVLGASHQCVVRSPAGALLSETVACLEGDDGQPLPGTHERVAGGLRYAFASSVARVSASAVRGRAESLRAAAAADPLGLAGVFPGSPDALTALSCRPVRGGVAWRTVHLYPHTREVVETSSSVVGA